MSEKQILVVEDESSISDTIGYALRTEGFVPVCCATGGEAVKEFEALSPALVILDVGLPDISGFEVCKELRKHSAVPILFLTARGEEIDRILGLELGGDDYIQKPFSPRELVARVKAVLRRTQKGDGAPSTRASTPSPFTIDEERRRIQFTGKPLDLSRYEYRLLRVLLRRPGRVFSREELMSLCWEEPDMSLERTVDSHIKSLRAKLREVQDNEWIITHRGFGYSLKDLT